MRQSSSTPPSRTLGGKLPTASSGARKEGLRQRAWKPRAHRGSPRDYVELRMQSAFSFLEGASLPEDLIEHAAARGLPAAALIEVNGVYGAPRFHTAAKRAGIRALVGADLVLNETNPLGSLRLVSPGERSAAGEARLSLLVRRREGYRNLCRLITEGALANEKGEARFDLEMIERYASGLHCLTGGSDGIVARTLRHGGIGAASDLIGKLKAIFSDHVHVELQRHHLREQEHRNQALIDIARNHRLQVVATNAVRFAAPGDRELADVLSCIRHGTNLDAAGTLLEENAGRHVRSAAEMCTLFSDLPHAIDASIELASELDFTLANLGYRFPDYPLPPGETAMSYLRQITWNGARARFRPLTVKAQAQIDRELTMIEKLDLAGYFLIVWDIVQFCLRENILVQGRGSAANSAVCYALSITAVDPVKMELLFERFLSEERGEWPDIDLDLPSGDQRERAIQYVYDRYGERGAAMTANVITYRERSAAREVGKALGFSPEQIDRFAKQVGRWTFGEIRETVTGLEKELQSAGLDPDDGRVRHLIGLWQRIQNLPRHLGQHSGGMVMTSGRLDEVVPLEPASMPGRVVIQWDKDDCADLGIIKVDLLGLGMLAALERAIPIIRENEKTEVDLAHLPQDDPLVYRMLNEADTVGVFQVESRAQMASLPRNRPEKFYDLVIQVAIIRPGPIVGGMVHPFFDRRQGKREVEYPHPSLEPILKRTLGVPLFQEQLLRIAMVAAGFSGGEAEELRRAMGFKRSVEKMQLIEMKLRSGMEANGITGKAQDQIVQSITSFALYGFPESHAASFALIAYASAYIRAHHPAAFLIGMLNSWPMGFYHPATLIKDAQRHGVSVLPVDVNRSGWECSWEEGSVRLGMRYVNGLREQVGRRIEQARANGDFESIEDLEMRCRTGQDQLTRLAWAGALSGFGQTRRSALWQVARVAREAGVLFEKSDRSLRASPLSEMSALEETVADYHATQLTTGPHLMEHLRSSLKSQRVLSAAELLREPGGKRVRTAGAVIVRQRPATGKGFVFLTLEDETGMAQAIVNPSLFRDNRSTIVTSPGLIVEGILQKEGGQPSLRAERFWPVLDFARIDSHDFH